MTNAKLATDEQVARFKVRAVIGALWSDEALSLIARIEADREETARLTSERNALSGINREFAEKIAALRADQSDWRKGVGFIASALGIDSLSCVDIAERGLEIRAERDALKAEVETVRGCLHELAATVRGEAPSLLNEDSGGDAFLSMRIDAALGTGMAR